MIRDTISDDIDGLITLAKATGLFEEEQLDELTATIEQCCQGETNEICVTDFETDPVGVAYLAPERMTDGTWNLYLLAVHPKYQRQGRGAALIDYVEKRLIQDKVRLLLVETAGTDDLNMSVSSIVRMAFNRKRRFETFISQVWIRLFFERIWGKRRMIDKMVFVDSYLRLL